jgi:hypothetical protein
VDPQKISFDFFLIHKMRFFLFGENGIMDMEGEAYGRSR